MNEIMRRIFSDYEYSEVWRDEDKSFWVNADKRIASYFLIYYVDATSNDMSKELLLNKLNSLENNYVEEGNQRVKSTLAKTFSDETTARQLDKNLSVIYAVKLSNLEYLEKYRNFIYAVEESPYYFRRFVLPYTDNQVDELKKEIVNYPEKSMPELLTELSNDDEAYYRLASHKYSESLYELVIRLFSKIPFLQYRFKAEQKPLSIDERVRNDLPAGLEAYHKAVSERVDELDSLITLFSAPISNENVNSRVKKIMGDDFNVTI